MHALYTGVTLSGKTTIARYFCRAFQAQGKTCIVYDPVGTPTKGGGWGDKAKIFEDELEFLDYLHLDTTRDAHVFIDEAGDFFGVSDKENHWLARRGRHYGLRLHMIAQRPNMLAPNVRGQLASTFMFRLAYEDARAVGQDMGHSGLHKISLDTGDFLHLKSGSAEVQRANVFQLIKE